MKYLTGILALVLCCGCNSQASQQKVVAQVGHYSITAEEFQEAYKNSSYAAQGTPESRQDFLNNMINQKLILIEAQRRGLDRDPQFLKMVESFWQQSLVTVAMQQKVQEGGNLDAWVSYLKQNTKIDINQEYLK